MSPGELRDQFRRPQFRLSDTPAPSRGDQQAPASPTRVAGGPRTLLSSLLAYLKQLQRLRRRKKLLAIAALERPAKATPTPPLLAAPLAQSRPGKPVQVQLHWRFQSTTRLTRLPPAPAQETQKTRAPGASSVNSNLGP